MPNYDVTHVLPDKQDDRSSARLISSVPGALAFIEVITRALRTLVHPTPFSSEALESGPDDLDDLDIEN
ncbi:hypothetical protein EXIGLDRAFT_775352 [Exidia glandulosa HHB12029]|uniref:Uncharacterized protein n=1 Tax=Exidia glandulosa HHB12029 TaxID=1314781 RepID=A0A165ZUK6_EXIGL|nr:hypothetical protein EXIGLDRAFT_775352 [Exidia glandulosa HHB12029]